MRKKVLPIALVLVAATFTYAQASGNTGSVLNEDGQPIKATVCTSVTSGNSTGITCRIPTDQDGEFQIENVEFGNYGLFAIDVANGYSIENQHPFKVRVTAENPSPNVIIRMQPRGGVLTGSVKDKLTGKSLDTAWVQWTTIDNGAGGGSARAIGGKFQIVAPIASDLIVCVTARGYKGWVYAGDANSTRPVLRLGSGEPKILDIELEPLSPAAP